jgi:NADPH:quinone reductase-like Zn-dependent oxidoreductase
MKAIFFEGHGGPEVLQYGERPTPTPRADQVLVEVHAAGINPRDWRLYEGTYPFGFLAGRPPTILGSDVSGVVVDVGAKVTQFAPGDAVFGMQSNLGRMGCYAEYVAIKATCLARKPASGSHADAAALPLAALTAYQALHRLAGITAGTRVTIVGASGGVGHYAVQLARAAGAHVTAVCGSANAALVRELGAEEVVDYRAVRWPEAIREQDVVFDTVGSETLASGARSLRRGGLHITTITSLGTFAATARATVTHLVAKGPRAAVVMVQPRGRDLDAIARLLASGDVRSVIDEIYPLAQAADALRKSRSLHTRGKLVLEVRPS